MPATLYTTKASCQTLTRISDRFGRRNPTLNSLAHASPQANGDADGRVHSPGWQHGRLAYGVSVEGQVDCSGFVWKLSPRQRLGGIALALIAAATIAGTVFAAFRLTEPRPSHFNHGVWLNHPDSRRFMLADLLASKLCPGTPAARVYSLLGKPDYRLPNGSGQPPSLAYELGTPDPLTVYFEKARSGRTVVHSVLPPFWPRTGCWT
jgi:hypothetical protein